MQYLVVFYQKATPDYHKPDNRGILSGMPQRYAAPEKGKMTTKRTGVMAGL